MSETPAASLADTEVVVVAVLEVPAAENVEGVPAVENIDASAVADVDVPAAAEEAVVAVECASSVEFDALDEGQLANETSVGMSLGSSLANDK